MADRRTTTFVIRMLVGLPTLAVLVGVARSEEKSPASAELVRIADAQLQIAVEPTRGTLRELVGVADGDNRLAGDPTPLSLWEIIVGVDERTVTLEASQVGPPTIVYLSGGKPGVRLTWNEVPLAGRPPLRVVAEVCLDEQGSRWTLAVTKPEDVRLTEIRFPRVPALKPREREVVAVPVLTGRTLAQPRKMLTDPASKNPRFDWKYPFELSMQCLAYYQPDGPGFYAACDDTQAYLKAFALWGDPQKRVHFEAVHFPEGQAAGASEYRMPYGVVLGAMRGDWSGAAERYRQSLPGRAFAARGRLGRDAVPAWVRETGLWVWNRGRSEDVLAPAAALQKHLGVPVSILWHWWHDCAYDAGFPEYLPPREGTEKFQAAMASAHEQGLHAILYMNQRLWGINTESWGREGAERYAVKGPDGKIKTETYNTFMQAPCCPMCIHTDYWRNKYSGVAREALSALKADGIYMDQTGVRAACFDAAHGHVVGSGRYWFEGIGPLTAAIREGFTPGRVALGGEYCIEPVLENIDLALALELSADRLGLPAPWEAIPFFQAVYHSSSITFGSMAGLVHPPYDERWPAEKAPKNRLTLLDRKFSDEFYLEQARSFVWGVQPMICNFRPELFRERPEEVDYLVRVVRTRQRALKYLLHGTWLRPPSLDVPTRDIDVARLGVYTPLAASTRRYPAAMAGAWRAADGDVAVAVASIHGTPLAVRLPIDAAAYGLPPRCKVARIDASGRHPQAEFDRLQPVVVVELPPRAVCVLEFSCAK